MHLYEKPLWPIKSADFYQLYVDLIYAPIFAAADVALHLPVPGLLRVFVCAYFLRSSECPYGLESSRQLAHPVLAVEHLEAQMPSIPVKSDQGQLICS